MDMPLKDLLIGYNFKSLRECYAILQLLQRNSYSLQEFYDFVDTQRENYGAHAWKEYAKARDVKNSRALKIIPQCPKCRRPLQLHECKEHNFETRWKCLTCSYEWFTDVSLADYRLLIDAAMRGEKPDFPPEDVRASKEERERRRHICEDCEDLTSNSKCRACGCGMKHRTYYNILKCPKKKW